MVLRGERHTEINRVEYVARIYRRQAIRRSNLAPTCFEKQEAATARCQRKRDILSQQIASQLNQNHFDRRGVTTN